MKFTTVAADAFSKIQLNAGVLLTEFDPANPPSTDADITTMRSKIFGATSGGASFSVTPEFVDFGEDIDNIPANTKELKKLQSVTAVMSGTLKTVDTDVAKALMAAADIGANGVVTPRADLLDSDFSVLWWVGDYSDVNTGSGAGFIAIKLINALSTGGFSLQPNDKSKGDFSFEFTGHYSIDDMTVLPYLVYIVDGEVPDTSLSALTIGTLTLTPTFAASVLSYTAATTNETDTITATATDSDATVTIKNGTTSVTSGSAATWTAGKNTVTIEVTNGSEKRTYTVEVTKS